MCYKIKFCFCDFIKFTTKGNSAVFLNKNELEEEIKDTIKHVTKDWDIIISTYLNRGV